MIEKNRLINMGHEPKRNKALHGNYAHIDPNAEISSAFINQAISQVDGYDNGCPMVGEDDVVRAKQWVDDNHK